VRCYKGFATIGSISNVQVYYTIPEVYNIKLFTCINCGEIFVADFENPKLDEYNMLNAVSKIECPTCSVQLDKTLDKYPDTFVYLNNIGHFEPSSLIPPDNESMVKEFYEITV
jgi:DNA-directed RNA polymerase subunit RPC12/RpoP